MKYNEFKITSYTNDEVKKDPKLIDAHKTQVPTERGFVMCKELSAKTNNFYKHSTGLYYELAEDQPQKKLNRDELKAKAKELGIEFHSNIKTDKLVELINKK